MMQAFICDGVRTPIGRYAGALAPVRADDLASRPIAALLARSPGLDPGAIDEVVLGCANQAGEDNRNVARMAALLAGLPTSVPGVTVNRLCGSGLEAAAHAARAIQTGEVELAIAGGVESMSRAPFVIAKAMEAFGRTLQAYDTTIGWRFVNPALYARYGADSMPETAENLARELGITRADQDLFAWRSQMRARAAQERDFFAGEIIEVQVEHGQEAPRVIAVDEHPRPDTTLDRLAQLRPVLGEGGTVTAGNASGINDGACALLLASEKAVQRFGLKPLARVLGSAAAGVAPRIMGIGPVPASRKLLARLSLSLSDIDVIELNEAFAAQALAVLRELGLPDDAQHVNPNGGAIALGHPLGMSGARLLTTACRALQESRGRYGLCTMCIGVGQGISMVIERA